MEMENMHTLKLLLTDNGWSWITALCTMIFILFHFPCSTTCLTIKKETGSLKWTAAAAALPTGCGALICFIISTLARLTGIAA